MTSFASFSPLLAGALAPDFRAHSYDGREITLSVLCAQGPVALIFIRGFG
jgi:hypothetical protein